MSAQLLGPVPGTQCDSPAGLPTQPCGLSSGHIVAFIVVTRQPMRMPTLKDTNLQFTHEGVVEQR